MQDTQKIKINTGSDPEPEPEKTRDLKTHRIKPWAWFLWLGFDLCLVAYTIKSTADVWPLLLWLALLGGSAVLCGSLYVSAHSYDKLPLVRQRATAAALYMTLALLFNVLTHGAISRKYATAQEKRQEQIESNKLTSDEAGKQRRDLMAILDKQTALVKANAEVDRNATLRYDAATRNARVTGIRRAPANTSTGAPIPTLSGFQPVAVTAVEASPADEAEKWFWIVFLGFAIEIIVAALCATWVKKATLLDLDNDGRLDSEQENAPEKRGFWQSVVRGRGASLPSQEVATATATGGSVPDDYSPADIVRHLNENHPNTPAGGSKTTINGQEYESDGRAWRLKASGNDADFTPRPAVKVLSRPATARFDAAAETEQKADKKSRPDADGKPAAGSDSEAGDKAPGEKLSGKSVRIGSNWKVLGVTLPDIPGHRYEGKAKRGSIMVVPIGQGSHGYAANLGKRLVDSVRPMPEPERFETVRAHIFSKIANGKTQGGE